MRRVLENVIKRAFGVTSSVSKFKVLKVSHEKNARKGASAGNQHFLPKCFLPSFEIPCLDIMVVYIRRSQLFLTFLVDCPLRNLTLCRTVPTFYDFEK